MKHDKELLRRRFARNLGTYDTLADVQRAVAGRLAEAIFSFGGDLTVRQGIELGAGTGFLTRHLVRLFPDSGWQLNDLVPRSSEFLPQGTHIQFIPGDGEALTRTLPAGGCDLIASASTVQWFDDLPEFISRAAGALRPGGMLALSTFGPDNFREITATTGQGLSYFPLEEFQGIFQKNGFELILAEEWTEQQCYRSPLEVLRHLRLTGVNAVAAERWTHSRLRQFEADYQRFFAVDGAGSILEEEGNVSLTFHPILLIGKKS